MTLLAGTVGAITATDDELADMLQSANMPSLLAALAYETGDRGYLPGDVRPLPAAQASAASQGGLTAADLDRAREVALQALRSIRDGRSPATTRSRRDRIKDSMDFLTGGVGNDYLPLLTFELGIDVDEFGDDDEGDSDTGGSSAAREQDPAVPQQFSVVIIGAGMSGIAAARELGRVGVDHVVLERHPDVGGVWMENDYPGCRLDSNNFTYSYSFHQKSDWVQEFSTQDEVQRYFSEVATATGVRDRTRFSTQVVSATWDDTSKIWSVACRDAATGHEYDLQANAVVSAVGQLNEPNFPDIPGRESFRGQSWHTARWNHRADLAGRRVAVIGSGASAYQVVPAIVDEVGSLVVFQRSAPYMLPTPTYHKELPDGQRWLMDHVPTYHRWYRFYTFWTAVEGKQSFSVVDPAWHHDISVSESNEELRQELVELMTRQYEGRPDLVPRVTPDYPPYGKRMLRDNGVWARALKNDHTELVTQPIARITPAGIVTTDGVEHDVDTIVYATGFRARDMLSSIELTGRNGANLRERWKDDPRAHLGIVVPDFPNLFLLYGPNTNLVVNGSQVLMVECSIHYVLQCLRMLWRSGGRAMDCRTESLESYVEWIDAGNGTRTWGSGRVRNWYKNSAGRVTQNWPFSILKYWEVTRAADPDDYILS